MHNQNWHDRHCMVRLFQKVETETDASALVYRGLKIWPVIRNLLCRRRYGQTGSVHVPDGDDWDQALEACKQGLSRRLGRSVDFKDVARDRWERHEQHMARLNTHGPIDLLVFVRAGISYAAAGHHPLSPILDPVMDHLPQTGWRAMRLEFDKPGPRHHNTVFFDPIPHEMALLAETAARGDDWEDDGVIAGLTPVKEYLSHHGQMTFSRRAFISTIQQSWARSRLFTDILTATGAKAALQSCFYHPDGMGLAAAARGLGRVCADLQHGQIGRNHMMYTGYSRVPADGFNTLPEILWSWGAFFADMLREVSPFKSGAHRVIIGGHPWLASWRAGRGTGDSEGDAFLSALSCHPVRILVSLQPDVADAEFQPHLRAAIRQSPADWVWLIRAHPHFRGRGAELEAEMRGEGIANIHAILPTHLPLPALLAVANRHVTAYSSTSYEAASFGIGTLAIHSQAAEILAPLLEIGYCRLASSPEALLAGLSSPPPQPTCPPPIEADPGLVRTALAELLSTVRVLSQEGDATPCPPA